MVYLPYSYIGKKKRTALHNGLMMANFHSRRSETCRPDKDGASKSLLHFAFTVTVPAMLTRRQS